MLDNVHPTMARALKPFVGEDRRTGSERRLAIDSQNPPTGNGAVVLEAVLQRIHNMASVSSIRFAGVGPLVEDLKARAEMGKAKYGTYLRVTNGRRAIVDFYQEMLDGLMYSMQARLEGDENQCGVYFELQARIASQVAEELNKRG